MNMQKLVLLIITLSTSLCFGMENQLHENNNTMSTVVEYELISKKILQLQVALQHGGTQAINALGFKLKPTNILEFSNRTRDALIKAGLIDQQEKINDEKYLNLIYSDEFLIEEIKSISRK